MPSRSSAKPRACPLCGNPRSEEYKPFCSRGCRDRDLLNWLGDGYRVPGRPADGQGREIGSDGLDSDADAPL